MYAIIKAGGRQMKVQHGQTVRVDKLKLDAGATVEFPVLMVAGPVNVHVGTPVLAQVQIEGTVLDHVRGEKVLIFKKRRRKNYRRKRGFRADYTVVRIGRLHGLDESWECAVQA